MVNVQKFGQTTLILCTKYKAAGYNKYRSKLVEK